MSENQFYYKGKFFDKKEDFWHFVDQWQLSKLDEQSATDMMMSLKNQIIANLKIYENETHPVTNREFELLCGELFTSSFTRLVIERKL